MLVTRFIDLGRPSHLPILLIIGVLEIFVGIETLQVIFTFSPSVLNCYCYKLGFFTLSYNILSLLERDIQIRRRDWMSGY